MSEPKMVEVFSELIVRPDGTWEIEQTQSSQHAPMSREDLLRGEPEGAVAYVLRANVPVPTMSPIPDVQATAEKIK